MKRLHISSLLCLLPAILALMFLRTGGIANAASSLRGTWQIVPSPNVGSGNNNLNAVAANSTSDIWAVGYSSADLNAPAQSLIEHYDGTQWSVVASPTPPNSWTSDLSGITALSANDIWAVGYFLIGSNTFSLIEHWDGTQWSIISNPDPGAYSNTLTAVTAISTSDIWAVGSFATSSTSSGQTLTEHWDGTQWSVVVSPNVGSGYNTLNGVSATATNDVWAVGYGQNGLVEHWDGAQWSIVFNQGFNFTAVTAVTGKDVWAVGYLLHNGVQRPLLEHWNGTTWGKAANPNPGGLSEARGVTAISPHNVWAVGYNNPNTLTEHWNGNRWSIVASPNGGSPGNFLLATTGIPNTKQVIAVGYYYVPNGDPESIGTAQTLVESFS